jgi:drug/metabolite transporter superfamily protein YnfA
LAALCRCGRTDCGADARHDPAAIGQAVDTAPYLALAAALPVEAGMLFALWHWWRSRTRSALTIGWVSAVALLALLAAARPILSGGAAAGLAGPYVFSALLSAWWRDGRHPASWSLCELLAAAFAAGLFGAAASAA